MRIDRRFVLGAALVALGIVASACGSGGDNDAASPSSGGTATIASTLTLGGPPECPTRPFCAIGLEDTYGVVFGSFKPLDVGGPLTVAALDSGAIDAYASDRTILIGMGRTSKNPEKLSLIEEFFSYEPHGFMLKRGDAAFRLTVNRALAALYRSGEIVPIYEKWFGSMSTAGPLIGAMYLMNGLPE